ncbi:hypothetical protein BJ994_002704 [Arthrobacter pigmenti]|uniref:Uncharacterized protein n=1 Tax=Arthrobacter pigmenti TaxID=271432 RepID=A0A846RJY8_9MICC|nr:hypothetical protein [Arthrobacter pigmenti]NJC23628.1 hypothetical protein [Arthrobacter pigmenti]
MNDEKDVRIVSQFVLRARRVAAHSLAQERGKLETFAGFKIDGQVTSEGVMSMRRELPDEEVFESLAARVRPMTLEREPIYFKETFKALHRLLESSDKAPSEEMGERLAQLHKDWAAIDLQGRGYLTFWVQAERRDGSGRTPPVSDIQLASSWMYADLVHSDPKGPKRDGLLFPIKERYSAAVTVFSRLALLTLATHDAFIELYSSGAIELDPLSLDTEIVVGKNELIDEGVAYVGPTDGPMPSMESVFDDLPEGWEHFTPTVLLRNNPHNQVEVVISAADGSTIATHEAAVSARWQESEESHWAVLIAGVVTAEFAVRVQDRVVSDGRFIGWDSNATTNKMKLADLKLQREMREAAKVNFFASDTEFFSFTVPPMSAERAAFIDVSIDTFSDLVAIEEILEEPLAPLEGSYSIVHRATLRQARLLMEGHIVPLAPSPMQITAPSGVVPQAVLMAKRSFKLGNSTYIPIPQLLVRHPLMRADQVAAVPASDPPTDSITMTVPIDEPFVAWVPELLPHINDEDLRQPTRLGLNHLDESTLFGLWSGTISTIAPPVRSDHHGS